MMWTHLRVLTLNLNNLHMTLAVIGNLGEMQTAVNCLRKNETNCHCHIRIIKETNRVNKSMLILY